MTENSKVHLNIQSRQFNTLKSLLILAKIRNFACGAVVFGVVVFGVLSLGVFVFGAFVSWGFLSMGLLSEELFMGILSTSGAFEQREYPNINVNYVLEN